MNTSLLADVLPVERVLLLNCAAKNDALDALITCLSGAPEIGDADALARPC